MNKWWLLAFVLWSAGCFTSGFKYEGYRAGEAKAELQVDQQKVTISAEAGVIAKQQSAAVITQKESQNYEKNVSSIDDDYADITGGLYPANTSTGGRLRAATNPAAGVSANCTKTSKKYGLTPRQCDTEEAKLLALWDWVAKQRANTP